METVNVMIEVCFEMFCDLLACAYQFCAWLFCNVYYFFTGSFYCIGCIMGLKTPQQVKNNKKISMIGVIN